MGIEESIVRKVRGEENVLLTNLINAATEEQFKKVLETLESECLIEPETDSRFALI